MSSESIKSCCILVFTKFIMPSLSIGVNVFELVLGFVDACRSDLIFSKLGLFKSFNIINFSNKRKLHLPPFPLHGLAFAIIYQLMVGGLMVVLKCCAVLVFDIAQCFFVVVKTLFPAVLSVSKVVFNTIV